MSRPFKKEIEYEFHKYRKILLKIDILLSIFIFILLGMIRPDYLVIAAFLLTIPYMILSKRENSLKHLLVSFIVSFAWMIIAKNQYHYNQDFLSFFGISFFPLFAFSIGIFAAYILYSYFEHKLKEKGFAKKLLLFVIIYFPLLILAETIGYHAFDIHNVGTSQFPGLPFCNCIHAPHWMQASYFALGPIFFAICYLLKLENPHYRIANKKFKNKAKSSKLWKK